MLTFKWSWIIMIFNEPSFGIYWYYQWYVSPRMVTYGKIKWSYTNFSCSTSKRKIQDIGHRKFNTKHGSRPEFPNYSTILCMDHTLSEGFPGSSLNSN